ncbi:reverse transcriptase family protein [Acinetobacter baumannii]|uniref:reverse transcriptase family protein n=1 Tax=Acinetobacter baumannii TaxID=470 RepID=UPI0023419183|nr:reverse transcriptase family protein [Acinetobacter baumannii]MDC4398285.1 reverse transcriptase family protein [Acinetobacter baumannii]MDC5351783.1 reverse transcriptase family protein [Acinetobacter baumannii]WCS39931.1 reverse transcriptase family protein [Acinetobacter baumannii]
MSTHNYLTELNKHDVNPSYKRVVRQLATPLLQKKLPVILSLKHLSVLLDIPYIVLHKIVYRDGDFYKVFAIKKRSGGKRWITVPNHFLMKAQKWINENILNIQSTQDFLSISSTAYKKSSSHIINASMHLGEKQLIKLDILNFFESISERQVFKVFKNLGYKNSISLILTRICTRLIPLNKDKRFFKKEKRWTTKYTYKYDNQNNKLKRIGHLPQGAPTSPILANLVCQDLDSEIQNLTDQLNLNYYTRYADDIIISGNFINKELAISCIHKVSKILREYGFKTNFLKTKYCGSGDRKIITGICINDENQLRVPIEYKRKVRQEIYYIKKFGLLNHCEKLKISNPLNYVLRLDGKINYIKTIEPDIGSIYMQNLENAIPNLHEIRLLSKLD